MLLIFEVENSSEYYDFYTNSISNAPYFTRMRNSKSFHFISFRLFESMFHVATGGIFQPRKDHKISFTFYFELNESACVIRAFFVYHAWFSVSFVSENPLAGISIAFGDSRVCRTEKNRKSRVCFCWKRAFEFFHTLDFHKKKSENFLRENCWSDLPLKFSNCKLCCWIAPFKWKSGWTTHSSIFFLQWKTMLYLRRRIRQKYDVECTFYQFVHCRIKTQPV